MIGRFRARVLCLGNDLIADDAVGIAVARDLKGRLGDDVDVVDTIESGFYLLDHLLDVDRVIVVDAVATGGAPPGTVYELREGDVSSLPGSSPHYVGLFESLALGRRLGMAVAGDVTILAVETADILTLGAPMSRAVSDAVPRVVSAVVDLLNR